MDDKSSNDPDTDTVGAATGQPVRRKLGRRGQYFAVAIVPLAVYGFLSYIVPALPPWRHSVERNGPYRIMAAPTGVATAEDIQVYQDFLSDANVEESWLEQIPRQIGYIVLPQKPLNWVRPLYPIYRTGNIYPTLSRGPKVIANYTGKPDPILDATCCQAYMTAFYSRNATSASLPYFDTDLSIPVGGVAGSVPGTQYLWFTLPAYNSGHTEAQLIFGKTRDDGSIDWEGYEMRRSGSTWRLTGLMMNPYSR